MAHMDVLLCEDVDNLGQRGQVVKVRAGYGRNYLLPHGLAIVASAGNKKMIDEQKRVLAKREERERNAAQGESSRLEGTQLRFDRKVGEHGILFGSVTALDIAEALKAQGYEVERRRIALKEPIKEVGDYDITIKLHRDVTPSVKVLVRKEGAVEEAAAAEEAVTATADSDVEAATETAPEATATSEEAAAAEEADTTEEA
jgi:large subunit ribosomal protein L9